MNVIEVQEPNSGRSRRSVTARLIGRAAWRALEEPGTGRVLAVFQRSFYLETENGRLACLGPPGLGAGPLNLLCDLPKDWDWQSHGLRPNAPVRRRNDALEIGDRFACALSGADFWRPPAFHSGWRPASLAQGLRRLAGQARTPAEGLGRLIPDLIGGSAAPDERSDDTAVLARARPALGSFAAWLDTGDHPLADPQAADFLEVLLGLGPGLTPSGDDFLGGAMIALGALGDAARAERLAALTLPAATVLTGKISLAHLACAAKGEGAAALHQALAALAAPGEGALDAALAEIDRIGHCSGWDALAGAVAVLAWRVARS